MALVGPDADVDHEWVRPAPAQLERTASVASSVTATETPFGITSISWPILDQALGNGIGHGDGRPVAPVGQPVEGAGGLAVGVGNVVLVDHGDR